jgi:hypothetical protein
MNATATPSITPEQSAMQDWRRLVEFLDRYQIADRVLSITRSLYGLEPTVMLLNIADIERAFAGSQFRMELSINSRGNMHAEVMVEGVRITSCGKADNRVNGEVTL